jgi:hypothetical protein
LIRQIQAYTDHYYYNRITYNHLGKNHSEVTCHTHKNNLDSFILVRKLLHSLIFVKCKRTSNFHKQNTNTTQIYYIYTYTDTGMLN